MSNYFEKIAAGKLAKANGGGAFSQTWDYKLVVCYANEDKIYLATKDVRAHTISGTAYQCRALPGEAEFGWTYETVFDHETPTGGDPTATVVSPPVLWVARSGEYLPATTTHACRTNIIHLAWTVKFTSGGNNNCYQVFHCMRNSDGDWTCAAGTIASLNAVTTVSATTGQWLNPQMIGLRRWDSDNSRFESYGTTPTSARTTLYLTYWGRESNAGTTPNNIYLARLGTVANNYKGNDWDDTQVWQPYADHKNMTSSVYADSLYESYTLSKVSRTVAPTGTTSNVVFSHTAGLNAYHYITVAYTRKNVIVARPGYFPVYRKYRPDTDTVGSEEDPCQGMNASWLPTGRTTTNISSPEQEAYVFDGALLFRPTSGGSSGIPSQLSNGQILPMICGYLNYYDTNRNRCTLDGDPAESLVKYGLDSWYAMRLKYPLGQGGSYDFYTWAVDEPIQHGSSGVSANYSASYNGATGLTPAVSVFNTRTGVSTNRIGADAYIFLMSTKHTGYTGNWDKIPTDPTAVLIPPAGFTSNPETGSNWHHPANGGTHYRGATYQIYSYSNSGYTIGAASSVFSRGGTQVTWPQMGDYNCITPVVFRAPWFQDGSAPYTMSSGWAFVFEAYKEDGVDNEIWMGMNGYGHYTWDNTSPWGFYDKGGSYFSPGGGYFVSVPGNIETEWINNTMSYNGYGLFAGETRRYLVRSTVRQDESASNKIARPTYGINFNFDVFNAEGLQVTKWNPADPYIFFEISQYAATTPQYIGFAVKNSADSIVRTAAISGRARIGTVTLSLGVEGDTHWDARRRVYTSSVTAVVADGETQYLWIKWTPPGGLAYPVPAQAIDIWLLFEQAT